MLIVLQPAGSMESFFRQGALTGVTREEVVEVNRRHGMEVVGPPLQVD
jgi:hypothetical protein